MSLGQVNVLDWRKVQATIASLALLALFLAVAPVTLAGVTGNLQLTASTTTGSPGDAVTVSGVVPLGYSVNVSFIQWVDYSTYAYTVLATQLVPVGAQGRFSTTLIIPKAPYGSNYAIYAFVPGFESQTRDFVNFTIVPKLILNVTTVRSGTDYVTPPITGSIVNITGVGFNANASVMLTIADLGVQLPLTPTTDSTGTFTATWTVINVPAGTHILTATDSLGAKASTNFTVVPTLWFYDEVNGVWTSLLTVSGPWVRDLEENIKSLNVLGTGFDAKVSIVAITFSNTYYYYKTNVSFTSPTFTDANGIFMTYLSIGHIPGGTYNVTVTENTSASYVFAGAITFNAYIEAYDFAKYSALYGTAYNVSAASNPALKVTSAGAQVIVFGWAFAPGTITTPAGNVTVPAHIFIDVDVPENALTIYKVVKGTQIDQYNFLPDANGFNVVIALMPSQIVRGGHEIGETQNITAPVQLRFSARTNIAVGPAAFFTPPAGTVGPYTTIAYTYNGIGVVKGSYAGPFFCINYGTTVCGESVTFTSDQIKLLQTGLGTTITVSGTGFDAGQPVMVFIRGVPPVDLRVLYPQYFATYGSLLASFLPDGILVANTTTDSYGSFKVSFVFPTLPGAQYEIWVFVGRIAGGYDQVKAVYMGNVSVTTFTVLPGFFVNPAVAVGPYVAEVIATGLPYGAAGGVAGVAIRTTALDGTQYRQDLNDGIMGVNMHVTNWRITPNGTLVDVLSPYVFPGIYIPVLEPGVYELRLIMPDGSLSQPTYIGIFNNLSLVAIKSDIAILQAGQNTILMQLASMNAEIRAIHGDTVTISSTVGTIKATLDALKANIASISDGIVTITTALGQINGTLVSISGDVATIKTSMGTLNASINSLSQSVSAVNSMVNTLSSSVNELSAKLSTVEADIINNITGSVNYAISQLNSAMKSGFEGLSGQISSTSNALSGQISSAANSLSSQISSVQGSVSTVSNYVIVAIIIAAIAAAAALYEIVLLHRKLAG
ncbi:MAG: hypothetical protein ABWK00_05325 [Desulfurococcaceae archaeon]